MENNMGANAEQVLNDTAAKAGFVIISSSDGVITSASLGFDCFTGFKASGSASAVFKAKGAKQIQISTTVRSDFSTTGNYTSGSAETLFAGDSIVAEFTEIAVTSGTVIAFLGRTVNARQASQPK
jgi:hypothetical protein